MAMILATVLACLLLTGASCGSAEVTILPGSTARRLEFAITKPGSADPIALALVAVSECAEERIHWLIRAVDPNLPPPNRIRYGELPLGFSHTAEALPLLPGCYEITLSPQAGGIQFEVLGDSTIRVLPISN